MPGTLREILIFLLHIISRRTTLFIFMIIIFITLTMLSLTAVGYIKSINMVFDIFHPISKNAVTSIIVSSDSISPFTSMVNLKDVEEKLSGFRDIKITPVFVTIGFVDLKPMVVYELSYVNNTCAYLDQELLKDVGNRWKGYIPIYSIFTQETLFLRICGVGDRPGIGVSHEVATKIRGVPQGYYSFIVVEVYNNSIVKEICRILAPNFEETYIERLIRRATLIAIRRGRITEVKEFWNPTEVYLTKFGIYRDYVTYFAYAIALSSLTGLPLLWSGVIEFLNKDVKVFTMLGIPRKSVAISILILLILSIVIGNILAKIMMDIKLIPTFRFLNYVVPMDINLKDLVLIMISQLFLSILGYIMRLRYVEI